MPTSEHLSAASHPVKTRNCRFCLHELFRSGSHALTDNRYCPLDLYSPQVGRVERAVRALWTRWIDTAGKANNLRLFVDGRRLDPSKVR